MSDNPQDRQGGPESNAAAIPEAAHELDEEVTCTGGRWDDEREFWLAVTGNVTVRLSRLPEDLVEREGA